MEMLNAVPQIFVAGENDGEVSNFITDVVNSRWTKPDLGTGGQAGSAGRGHYHPPLDYQRAKCDLQQLTRDVIGVAAVEPPQRPILGFKEIRFTPMSLDAMLQVFPCAKFIINVRLDLEAQHSSLFHKKTTVDDLNSSTNGLLEWAKNNSAFVLPLEHFTKTHFNELLRWLGIFDCEYVGTVHANSGQTYLPANAARFLDRPTGCTFRNATTTR